MSIPKTSKDQAFAQKRIWTSWSATACGPANVAAFERLFGTWAGSVGSVPAGPISRRRCGTLEFSRRLGRCFGSWYIGISWNINLEYISYYTLEFLGICLPDLSGSKHIWLIARLWTMNLNGIFDSVQKIVRDCRLSERTQVWCTVPIELQRFFQTSTARFSDFAAGLPAGSRAEGQGPWAKASGAAQLFPDGRGMAMALRIFTTMASWWRLIFFPQHGDVKNGSLWYTLW